MDEAGQRPSSLNIVTAIMVANAIVFLLWFTTAVPLELMAGHFLVSWEHLAVGRIWVLLTAVFSHNLLFHLLINMIVLLSFGPPLERLMGSGRFLGFYLVAGLMGSLAHAVVSNFLIDRPQLPALGASSSLAGVLLLFAFVFPKFRVLLFFVIPMPAIVAALLFVGVDIWGLIMQVEGEGLPIGHGAHLGGAITGIVYFLMRRDALRERRSRLQSGLTP